MLVTVYAGTLTNTAVVLSKALCLQPVHEQT